MPQAKRAWGSIGFAVFLCARVLSVAQEPHQIAIMGTDQIPQQHQQRVLSIKAPVKCSPSGELYMELLGGGVEPGVSIVSEDHQHISWFGLSQVADLENANLLDFAPGVSHDVFLLGSRNATEERRPADYLVVHFKEGASASVTKLNLKPGFQLRQIALLGADDFVVSGFFGWQSRRAQAFTAIFDASGQFLREIRLPADLSPHNGPQDQIDRPAEAAEAETTSLEWLDLSSLQTADDGSVYLIRNTPVGPLFLITPGGAVRRVTLMSPEKEAVLSSVKIADGRMVAEYYIPGPSGVSRWHFLTVTDLSTGQRLDTLRYQDSESTGVGLVCYRNQTFDFLGYADGHLRVARAVSH
jgi:hypothetical protein